MQMQTPLHLGAARIEWGDERETGGRRMVDTSWKDKRRGNIELEQ
jgi:hypothetical protein